MEIPTVASVNSQTAVHRTCELMRSGKRVVGRRICRVHYNMGSTELHSSNSRLKQNCQYFDPFLRLNSIVFIINQ